MPPQVAASTGLDILSHAIESFTAMPYTDRPLPARPMLRPAYQGSNPISDIWSMQALRMVNQFLVRAVDDPSDDEARANMLLAAAYAGVGFGNAGVHLPHGMSYPVSGNVKTLLRAGLHHRSSARAARVLGDPECAGGVPLHGGRQPRTPSCRRPAALGADVSRARPDDAGKILADRITWFMQRLDTPNGLPRSATPRPIFPRSSKARCRSIVSPSCLRGRLVPMSSPRSSKTRWSPGNVFLARGELLAQTRADGEASAGLAGSAHGFTAKNRRQPPNSFARPREGPASRYRVGQNRRFAVRQRGPYSRYPAPWIGKAAPLRHGRREARLSRGSRAHQVARHPAGLDRRLDLPRRARPSAGHGARRARPQAVPLSHAVARGARRSEVRAAHRVRAGAAAHSPAHGSRHAKEPPAARKGAGGGRAAPREDAHSRRQRRVRARQRLGRADDDARSACDDQGHHGALRVPRQERRRARDRPAGRAAGADHQGAARSARLRAVPVRGRGRPPAGDRLRPT